MTDSTCKACSGTWCRADHFVTDLGVSKAYLHDDHYFPGGTVVVLQRLATELFHLATLERIQVREEVGIVGETIAHVCGATEVTYGAPWQPVPHYHCPIILRHEHDPSPTEPVWQVVHEPVLRTGF